MTEPMNIDHLAELIATRAPAHAAELLALLGIAHDSEAGEWLADILPRLTTDTTE